MALRWRALPVAQAMDSVVGMLDSIAPQLASSAVEVDLLAKNTALPMYLTDRLSRLADDLSHMENRLRSKVDSVRKAIPEDALEREKGMTSMF